MTTRRQLLARLLGGSIALAAADIWIPGERTISLPSKGMPHGWLVGDEILVGHERFVCAGSPGTWAPVTTYGALVYYPSGMVLEFI